MYERNKIVWESWNAIEEDMVEKKSAMYKNLLAELSTSQSDDYEYEEEMKPMEVSINSNTPLITPFGLHSYQSPFKPSSRWECWIGHTNFKITHGIKNTLNKCIGVESLCIMGCYSFCVGVGKAFNSSDIRQEIESTFHCGE